MAKILVIFIIQVALLSTANPFHLSQHRPKSHGQDPSTGLSFNKQIAAEVFKALEARELTPAQQLRAKEDRVDNYLGELNNPKYNVKKLMKRKLHNMMEKRKFKTKLRSKKSKKMHKRF